ncbi:MAG: hypothetical protein KME46_34075 [Brasilonema angustatum HA4187-MV1]|nr:hypothetical protein [Brasilonema angustatum HA4187-MV1]
MNLKEVRKKLYNSAGYIRSWLTKQPGVKEESITDWLLFDVSNQLPNVFYHAFTRHQEGRETGADWEWWFLFPQTYVRFRVQAKKVSSTKDNYQEIARTNNHGLQIEKLLEDSEKPDVNAIPLYVLYSSVSDNVRCNNHQIVQNDGVFIAGAQQIYDFFIAGPRRKVTSAKLLKLSSPFSCFACCPLITAYGGLQRYLEYYFQPEVMPVSQKSNAFRGLHEQLPAYLSSFLEYDAPVDLPEWWENEFKYQLEDFNALLVYDFRNYKPFDFSRLTCSGDSWSQGATDEFQDGSDITF